MLCSIWLSDIDMSSREKNSQIKDLIDDLFSDIDGPLEDGLNEADAEKLLAEIAKIVPEDSGEASTDAVFGKTFINVNGITWAMLKAIVALGLAVAPDPTGLTKVGAAGIIWELIKDSNGHFRRLNSAEQIVVTAIASKGGEHWRANGHEYGVTHAQIEAYFEERDQIVPLGLQGILEVLASKNVIHVIPTTDYGETYRIAF